VIASYLGTDERAIARSGETAPVATNRDQPVVAATPLGGVGTSAPAAPSGPEA